MKKLIVVESPTKAKTIQKFLGKEYEVTSSFGHIRDLPSGKLGVDPEKDFEPTYVIPTKARKTVTALKKEAGTADETILATDEDREGEAIAWHLAEILGLKDPKRIVFHEITESAIQEALKNPRAIDENLVNAQQARRILDRLVGYKLSPFLWKKVARGLSAGRVQSATLRLVVDREREIQNFKPEEYWSITACLRKQFPISNSQFPSKSQIQNSNDQKEFDATLSKKDGKPIEKLGIKTKEETDAILKDLKDAQYIVSSVEKKETQRNPLPPFTTSTLQQEASKRLHFPSSMTMKVAQQLYETGHITYHRTDSLNLSQIATSGAKTFITKTYGENYWPGFARQFKTKSRGAQEAHEAIRPTYPDNTPEKLIKLTDPQKKLYKLIWQRFIASQMSPGIFDSTSIEIEAKNYTFRTNGQTLKFDGFLKVYPMKFEETDLPVLEKEEALELKELKPEQHFTQPPARYTEASLVKTLEQNGIGRPSTYAPTLSTIQERRYIEKNPERRFQPTEIGMVVNDLLVEHFPNVVDIGFTADMEEHLDEVAEGAKEWIPLLKEFYGPFAKTLEQKYEEVSKEKVAVEQTNRMCPQCGSPLVIRLGRFGKFYACTKFPECKFTESLENKEEPLNIACPKCGQGMITTKRTKRKKIFYGCNRYPECDFALWDKPLPGRQAGTGEKCEECGSLMIEKGGRGFCSHLHLWHYTQFLR
ncbi:MAG: type I DNA topoisomerase [Candidatus Wildermuthbacteria bacterium]|nr:type I DNA topoisomerase [Candidatus Wildermuthbacteria bacterium]